MWDKTEGARPAKGRYGNQCKYVVWGSRGPMNDEEGPCLPGVWRATVRSGEKLHQTGKPLSIMRELCRIAWKPGSLILDPFAGSGTTLVAARDADHRAIGIEAKLSKGTWGYIGTGFGSAILAAVSWANSMKASPRRSPNSMPPRYQGAYAPARRAFRLEQRDARKRPLMSGQRKLAGLLARDRRTELTPSPPRNGAEQDQRQPQRDNR